MSASLRAKLLLNGYVREIESNLIQQIIPTSIIELCLLFYYLPKLLFCIISNHQDANASFHIGNINANQTHDHESLSCQEFTTSTGWSVFLSGICGTRNFYSFPLKLSNKFKSESTNVLFTCCGYGTEGTDDCNAFIVNMDTFNIENWKLPNYPSKEWGTTSGFMSQSQTLIAVAWNSNAVNGLSFKDINNMNEDDNESWKWKRLSTTNEESRYNPCSVVIDDMNRYMIVGGSTDSLKVPELYDIAQNNWIKLANNEVNRIAAGICYNEIDKKVYVIGGYTGNENGDKSIEWYDFDKNIWKSDIGNTKYKYKGHPTVWMEGNSLLYVASVPYVSTYGEEGYYRESCEYIDLRIGKKWEIVYHDKMLNDLFGITPTQNNTIRLWSN